MDQVRTECDAPRCPNCGWPEREPYEILSRHRTSSGVVVYTRCICGALQVRVLAPDQGVDGPVLALGRAPGRPLASR